MPKTPKKIVTHGGVFHADDVLSVVLAKMIYCAMPVERRRPTRVEMNDDETLVIDVGGEYNPIKNNFDHHQSDTPTQSDGKPHAACSLIWPSLCDALNKGVKCHMSAECLPGNSVAQKHIGDWLAKVAAYDAGDSETTRPGLSELVSDYLPAYGEDSDPEDMDAAFKEVAHMVWAWVERKIEQGLGVSDARIALKRAETASQGRILVLKRFVPFQEHWDLVNDDLRFVVYPSARGGWACRTVPERPWGRQPRLPFPEAWRGLRDKKLPDVAGIPGDDEPGWFVHPAGFIAGASTRAKAIQLAEAVLD